MRNLLERLVRDEVNTLGLKEKLTGAMVKKDRRGTYQALNECTQMAAEITNEIINHIESWLISEILDGQFKKPLYKEIHSQIELETIRRGYPIKS